MNMWTRIGNASILIENAELLPSPLQGLIRLEGNPATSGFQATIEIQWAEAKGWKVEIAERENHHSFGRFSYLMEVDPLRGHIVLRFAQVPQSSDIYWLQRDIFGVIACLSGQVMLHGSSVTKDGHTFLFCGQSGAGKSTIARLLEAEGWSVINDEVNWLFHRDGEWNLVNQRYWFGAAEVPFLSLTRLLLLEQSQDCFIAPPPLRPETFARLLASHLSIDLQYDFLHARAEALKQLVETFPVNVLRFNLDSQALLRLLCTPTG